MTDRYTEGWRACREAAARLARDMGIRCRDRFGGEIAHDIENMPDPAPAALPDPEIAPGHTDLMVPPETLDAYMEANPLPPAAAPDARVAEIRKQVAAGYFRGEAGAAIAYLLAKLEDRR